MGDKNWWCWKHAFQIHNSHYEKKEKLYDQLDKLKFRSERPVANSSSKYY